ncbi:uncharacterized protein LOC142238610 [Haematobia irritans]|uniref:uncharacterized protein LOC142238610 n=1 Tax=Haematobia irritans TaxID=7368 RepID=UPI003F509781
MLKMAHKNISNRFNPYLKKENKETSVLEQDSTIKKSCSELRSLVEENRCPLVVPPSHYENMKKLSGFQILQFKRERIIEDDHIFISSDDDDDQDYRAVKSSSYRNKIPSLPETSSTSNISLQSNSDASFNSREISLMGRIKSDPYCDRHTGTTRRKVNQTPITTEFAETHIVPSVMSIHREPKSYKRLISVDNKSFTFSQMKPNFQSNCSLMAGKRYISNIFLTDDIRRELEPHILHILATRTYRRRICKEFIIKDSKYKVYIKRSGDLIIIKQPVSDSTEGSREMDSKSSNDDEISKGPAQVSAAPIQLLGGKPFVCDQFLEEDIRSYLDKQVSEILKTDPHRKRLKRKFDINDKKYRILFQRNGGLVVQVSPQTKELCMEKEVNSRDISSDRMDLETKNIKPQPSAHSLIENPVVHSNTFKENGSHDGTKSNTTKMPVKPSQLLGGKPFLCDQIIEEDVRSYLDKQVKEILKTNPHRKRLKRKFDINDKKYRILFQRNGGLAVQVSTQTKEICIDKEVNPRDISSDRMDLETKDIQPKPSSHSLIENPVVHNNAFEDIFFKCVEDNCVDKEVNSPDIPSDRMDLETKTSSRSFIAQPMAHSNEFDENGSQDGTKSNTSKMPVKPSQLLGGKPFLCDQIIEEGVRSYLDKEVTEILKTNPHRRRLKRKFDINDKKYRILFLRNGGLVVQVSPLTKEICIDKEVNLPDISSDRMDLETKDIQPKPSSHSLIENPVVHNNAFEDIFFKCVEDNCVDKEVNSPDIPSDRMDLETKTSSRSFIAQPMAHSNEFDENGSQDGTKSNTSKMPVKPSQLLGGKLFLCDQIIEEDVRSYLDKEVTEILKTNPHRRRLKRKFDINDKKYRILFLRNGGLVVQVSPQTKEIFIDKKINSSNITSEEIQPECSPRSLIENSFAIDDNVLNSIPDKEVNASNISSDSIEVETEDRQTKSSSHSLTGKSLEHTNAFKDQVGPQSHVSERSTKPPQLLAGKPFICNHVLEEDVRNYLDRQVTEILKTDPHRIRVKKQFRINDKKYDVFFKRNGDLIVLVLPQPKEVCNEKITSATSSPGSFESVEKDIRLQDSTNFHNLEDEISLRHNLGDEMSDLSSCGTKSTFSEFSTTPRQLLAGKPFICDHVLEEDVRKYLDRQVVGMLKSDPHRKRVNRQFEIKDKKYRLIFKRNGDLIVRVLPQSKEIGLAKETDASESETEDIQSGSAMHSLARLSCVSHKLLEDNVRGNLQGNKILGIKSEIQNEGNSSEIMETEDATTEPPANLMTSKAFDCNEIPSRNIQSGRQLLAGKPFICDHVLEEDVRSYLDRQVVEMLKSDPHRKRVNRQFEIKDKKYRLIFKRNGDLIVRVLPQSKEIGLAKETDASESETEDIQSGSAMHSLARLSCVSHKLLEDNVRGNLQGNTILGIKSEIQNEGNSSEIMETEDATTEPPANLMTSRAFDCNEIPSRNIQSGRQLLAGKPFICDHVLEEDVRSYLDRQVVEMLKSDPHRKRVNRQFEIKDQKYRLIFKRNGDLIVRILPRSKEIGLVKETVVSGISSDHLESTTADIKSGSAIQSLAPLSRVSHELLEDTARGNLQGNIPMGLKSEIQNKGNSSEIMDSDDATNDPPANLMTSRAFDCNEIPSRNIQSGRQLLAGKPFICDHVLEEDVRSYLDRQVVEMLKSDPHRKRVNRQFEIKDQKYRLIFKRNGDLIVRILPRSKEIGLVKQTVVSDIPSNHLQASLPCVSHNLSKDNVQSFVPDNISLEIKSKLQKEENPEVLETEDATTDPSTNLMAGRPFVCIGILPSNIQCELEKQVALMLSTLTHNYGTKRLFHVADRRYRVYVKRSGDLIITALPSTTDVDLENAANLSDISDYEVDSIMDYKNSDQSKLLKGDPHSSSMNVDLENIGNISDISSDEMESFTESNTLNHPKQLLAGIPFLCKEILEEDVRRELDDHVAQMIKIPLHNNRTKKLFIIRNRKYRVFHKRNGELIVTISPPSENCTTEIISHLSDISSDEMESVKESINSHQPKQLLAGKPFICRETIDEDILHQLEEQIVPILKTDRPHQHRTKRCFNVKDRKYRVYFKRNGDVIITVLPLSLESCFRILKSSPDSS